MPIFLGHRRVRARLGETLQLHHVGMDAVPPPPRIPFARNPSLDFDTLAASGTIWPRDIWSDGTTMYVSCVVDDDDRTPVIRAYNLSTKARDSSKDFASLPGAGNAFGIWSDNTTIYVGVLSNVIRAYNLSTKARDSSKDFTNLRVRDDVRDVNPRGLWSDGITMYVGDSSNDLVRGYNLSTKMRDTSKDLNIVGALNQNPGGIWADDETVWVELTGHPGDATFNFFKTIHAYTLSTRARDTSKDFARLTFRDANAEGGGIWSDGTTMWVAHTAHNKIYAYNMPI